MSIFKRRATAERTGDAGIGPVLAVAAIQENQQGMLSSRLVVKGKEAAFAEESQPYATAGRVADGEVLGTDRR
jgi:hypothetical protein